METQEKTPTGKGAKTKPETTKLPAFTVIKDGNGTEYKIANMANPYICQRKGIVEIEVLKKLNTMEPRYSFSNVYDSELGIHFGVVLGIDSRTKEIKWQRFSVGDFKRYDLTNHADAVEWAVMRRTTRLIGSPFMRGKPLYRMFDKEAEAREVIAKSTIRSKAMEVATQMIKIEDQADVYRNFGKNPAGHTVTTLHAEIIKLAERSPKEFIDMWENKNRPVVTLFNKCVAVGLINFDIAKGGYMWKDSLPMGVTEQTSQNFLLENKSVYNQAKIEAEQRDNTTKTLVKMTREEESFFGNEEVEDDQELVNLRIQAKAINIQNVMGMSKKELTEALDEFSMAG